MEKIHKFTLDISKGINSTSIEVVTQDYASHKFDITLIEDGYKPFNLDNTIVRLIVLKPDGKTVQQDCTIIDNQGRVSMLLQLNTINVSEICKAEIQIFDNAVSNKRLTSANFNFRVRKSLQDDETVASTDEFSMLQKAIEQAECGGAIDERITIKTGILTSLKTTEKSNLVGAINEVKDKTSALDDRLEDMVGNLENMMRNIFDGTTRFYAHRGLSAYYPENTLHAVKKASVYGFYGVEIDIQPTKDNEIILMHDDTVDRMTNGVGVVKDLNYSYISGLKIDGGNGLEVLDEEYFPSYYPSELYVPTFEDVVRECRRSNLSMQIELKSGGFTNSTLNKVVNIVDKYNMRNKVLFISFDFSYLEYLRTLSDNLMLLFVVDEVTPTIISKTKNIKNAGISASYVSNSSNIENVINNCHSIGLPIGFWTVDDITTAMKLVDYGCDFVTTNKIKGSKIVKSIRKYSLTTAFPEAEYKLINMKSYGGDDCTLIAEQGWVLIKHTVPFDSTETSSGQSIFATFNGGVQNYYVATRSDQIGSIRIFIYDRATGEPIDHRDIPAGLWFTLICYNNDLG